LQDELGASQQAAIESVAAEELAWQQYQRGIVDIITVLESQRRAFTAQSSLLSVMNNRLANRINLYLALGGDFTLANDAAEGPSHPEIE
jgi:outer membrane protein TolC